MPRMLKVGDRFTSFADAKKAIAELGDNTYTTFWKRDARTIASSKIARQIKSSLIYYQLVYACNHGGRKFKSSGKKIRQSWTFKEDCPVHVRFKASLDGNALEVTSIQSQHNHDTSKVLYAHTPSQRRLSSNMKESVKDYLNMKANRKMIQQKLQESTGKIITLQDLTNITKNDQSKTENLDNCLKILKTKYGAHAAVLRDVDNNFRGLFIQTPAMKSTMNAFPEFLAVDATYKLLKIGLPVFLIIVEDGNCQTEIVGVCILASEGRQSFTWFLETFKSENPAWINVKCIMTDKDLHEREVIKNCFPNVNLIICVFHTLKIFYREISCQKMGITPSQRTLSLELIQKLVYAKTDDDYEKYMQGLKDSVPRTVYEYFMKNWHNTKDEWNLGKNYFKNSFLNNTNNRLESINAKLKSVINKNSPLEHFINSLFTIISSLETERDHKAVYGILKKPVDMFPEDSDERKYFKLLTREASKHVLREIRISEQIRSITVSADGYYIITDSRGSTKTTVSSCNCVMYDAMILPCKHIFALRRHLHVELFDRMLVNHRWTMDYYKGKQRTL
ncbi:uncharacterized protein LOC116161019 [Photinus pyralis]|uniref:uncharacterized protein LOC116161019 n=1 Tax=Photinus pyralis TaxID=7054 RepID=UPI00126721ED|nr:uncharacterized protein LOC116161019 [Photinus pyralis]XP_031330059.1 uncharacterized protein LOC116161019 [Photinus pyralis]